MKIESRKYKVLIHDIGSILEQSRLNAVKLINYELVKAYWEIGRHIVNYEQHGNERAEYGTSMLSGLSKDLTEKYGKGFGRRNLSDMRRFYLIFDDWNHVSQKLYWSHYVLLLSVTDDEKRKFYFDKCNAENWSVRTLENQLDSSLYERWMLQHKKKGISLLPKNKQELPDIADVIKDPYVLDFLKIPKNHKLTEKSFEQKIINNLQSFILELGKGFAFIGRQYKISLGSSHFYVDLVFYHRILKCFVLIDLKIRNVKHNDIGQMNLYLNYFKAEENVEGDNDPIGIILSAEKDEILVQYAMGGISNKIFVSKYKLYLPDKKILQRKVSDLLHEK